MQFLVYLLGSVTVIIISTAVNRITYSNNKGNTIPLVVCIGMVCISWIGVFIIIFLSIILTYGDDINNWFKKFDWFNKAYNYFSGRDLRNKNVIYVEPDDKTKQKE